MGIHCYRATGTLLRTPLSDSCLPLEKTLPASRKCRAPTVPETVEFRHSKRQKLEKMDITKKVCTKESASNANGPTGAASECLDAVCAPLGVGIAPQHVYIVVELLQCENVEDPVEELSSCFKTQKISPSYLDRLARTENVHEGSCHAASHCSLTRHSLNLELLASFAALVWLKVPLSEMSSSRK